MLTDDSDSDTLQSPAKIDPVAEIPANITAEARAAIDDLDDEGRIDKMLRVGAAIYAAKQALPHGSLKDWYKHALGRSESWCCQYRRLYEDRDKLPEARAWAARTTHKLATCRGIEHLLRIVKDYKAKVLGDLPSARTAPRGASQAAETAHARGLVLRIQTVIDDTKKRLDDLRLEAETVPSSDSEVFRTALLTVIDRLGDQIGALSESCSDMQVSGQDVEETSV
jgi:hypothetical protein